MAHISGKLIGSLRKLHDRCILGEGNFASNKIQSPYPDPDPRPTQLSIPPGSVNEYQLQLGRQRQVWFIPLAGVSR